MGEVQLDRLEPRPLRVDRRAQEARHGHAGDAGDAFGVQAQEDAEDFLRQWEEMQKAAAQRGPQGDAAKRELDKALKSLGLRPAKSKLRSGSFGQALLLNYPNADDRARFNALKKMGAIPMRARIGGSIEIHGGGRLNSDWTDGCVSLENPEMADLYNRAYIGMPVTIVGTSSLGASVKE